MIVRLPRRDQAVLQGRGLGDLPAAGGRARARQVRGGHSRAPRGLRLRRAAHARVRRRRHTRAGLPGEPRGLSAEFANLLADWVTLSTK